MDKWFGLKYMDLFLGLGDIVICCPKAFKKTQVYGERAYIISIDERYVGLTVFGLKFEDGKVSKDVLYFNQDEIYPLMEY